jgi:LPXTG-site transpeptidase (sortase) family protein
MTLHLSHHSHGITSLFALLLVLLTVAPVWPVSSVDAGAPTPGATLEIPALGISAQIVTVYIVGGTWDVSQLGSRLVGHLDRTAWLGENGNIVLAGHSETAVGAQNGVFATLNTLVPGDEMILSTSDVTRHFVVTELRYVSFNDFSLIRRTSTEQLTLTTCALGTYSASLGGYSERLMVIATPVY